MAHDKGVQLEGAFVTGMLDLGFADAKGATILVRCHFQHTIHAVYCRFQTLSLMGSALEKGLKAQGIVTSGDVFLHNGLSTKGCVDLDGAKIQGQVNFAKGRIVVSAGDAFSAQGAQIRESVHLSDKFSATGSINLSGAKIGGQLDFEDGHFFVEDGTAVVLENTKAAQFLWRSIREVSGGLSLNNSHFDTLTDDSESWEKVEDLTLVGLTYDHISNTGDTRKRLEWLGVSDRSSEEFSPQPYTQLAKILREMGHDRDARTVSVEGEIRHRRSEWEEIETRRAERSALRRFLKSPNDSLWITYVEAKEIDQSSQIYQRYERICVDATEEHANRPSDAQLELARVGLRQDLQWLNAKDKLRIWWFKAKSYGLNKLVGYGYKPFNSLWALVVLVLLAAGLSQMAWRAGDFAPNSDVILSTAEWQNLAEDKTVQYPAQTWATETEKGRDYETFYWLAYGFDVVVPIVNIGQEAALAPSTTRGPWGWHLWWARWFFTVFGWIVTALGAAAIAGVIRRD